MLKMSFYDGTLDRAKAKTVIENSDKPCVYTYGFAYKSPTTYRKPIAKIEALAKVEKESYLDITEEEAVFHLNGYSGNDMW